MKLKNRAFRRKRLLLLIISAVVLVTAMVVGIVVITNINEYKNTIKEIIVTKQPNKLVYYIGEDPDYTGIKIWVRTMSDDGYYIDASECEFVGFDNSKANENLRITVKYKDYFDSFTVTIKEAPKATPTLVSITMQNLPKTEYKVGEWLDTDGGSFVCEYSDGSTFVVSLRNKHVVGYNEEMSQTPGVYELTVYYVDNGDMASCTYTITVTK